MSGKLYIYLTLPRPFLAAGALEGVVVPLGTLCCCAPSDRAELYDALLTFEDNWLCGEDIFDTLMSMLLLLLLLPGLEGAVCQVGVCGCAVLDAVEGPDVSLATSGDFCRDCEASGAPRSAEAIDPTTSNIVRFRSVMRLVGSLTPVFEIV